MREPYACGLDIHLSGGSRGRARGALPPLFLDQTEARRAEKNFFKMPPPPLSQGRDDRLPPTYLKVWIRHRISHIKDNFSRQEPWAPAHAWLTNLDKLFLTHDDFESFFVLSTLKVSSFK